MTFVSDQNDQCNDDIICFARMHRARQLRDLAVMFAWKLCTFLIGSEKHLCLELVQDQNEMQQV